MKLEPLRCEACGGGVPPVASATTSCPYCGHTVDIPEDYRELFVDEPEDASVRKKAARTFRRLSRAPGRWLDYVAIGLVLLVPPAMGAVVVRLAGGHLSTVLAFAAVIVPAVMPGTAVWVWSASIHATVARFRLALAGQPPEREGGPPRCRNCGAPLNVEPGALSAHCPYCGTDSLTQGLHDRAVRTLQALRENVRTLGDANRLLQVRRWMIVAGTTGAVVLLVAFASAAVFASLAMK